MRTTWSTILVSAICLASRAWAKPRLHDVSFVPDQILRMTAQNISINCESRYSVVINGTAPGPPVYLIEGKPQWIRVYNDIPDQNITVHWHGLAQRAAPFSDGTPLVSQWPVPPLSFFDYEIYPDKAGTFFYHSHVGFQGVSAYGALIVKERCPRPDAPRYDEEITLAIADYFNKTDEVVEEGLLRSPFRWPGESNALLLNGKSGQSFTHGLDSSCAPLIIKVKPDSKYRVRFIGGTALSLVTLGIEEHTNLTIIEADGTDSIPVDTDHLQLGSGQRFSIILTTKSISELSSLNRTNFWIRLENRDRPTNISSYALLSYDLPSATPLPTRFPSVSPVILPSKVYDWLENSLSPADPHKTPFPIKADRTVVITTHQYGTQDATTGVFTSKLEWGQNGNIWQPERFQVPYLVDFYRRGAAAVPNYEAALKNGGWDPKTYAFPAKVGEVVDIIWGSSNAPTGGWDVHPFHAHGLHFWDLGAGNGTYHPSATLRALALPHGPMIRDTTMLYRYATSGVRNTTAGWRAWRISFDEAGAFLLHCHVLQHHIMGMATAWVIGDVDDLTKVWPKAPYVEGYLEYGGNAVGNATWNPLVNEFFWPEGQETEEVCEKRGYFGTKKTKSRRGLRGKIKGRRW